MKSWGAQLVCILVVDFLFSLSFCNAFFLFSIMSVSPVICESGHLLGVLISFLLDLSLLLSVPPSLFTTSSTPSRGYTCLACYVTVL